MDTLITKRPMLRDVIPLRLWPIRGVCSFIASPFLRSNFDEHFLYCLDDIRLWENVKYFRVQYWGANTPEEQRRMTVHLLGRLRALADRGDLVVELIENPESYFGDGQYLDRWPLLPDSDWALLWERLFDRDDKRAMSRWRASYFAVRSRWLE